MKELEKLLKRSKSLTVLYVEDSLTVRKATQNILSKYFDHIDVSKDGKDALEQYTEFYSQNNNFL